MGDDEEQFEKFNKLIEHFDGNIFNTDVVQNDKVKEMIIIIIVNLIYYLILFIMIYLIMLK